MVGLAAREVLPAPPDSVLARLLLPDTWAGWRFEGLSMYDIFDIAESISKRKGKVKRSGTLNLFSGIAQWNQDIFCGGCTMTLGVKDERRRKVRKRDCFGRLGEISPKIEITTDFNRGC